MHEPSQICEECGALVPAPALAPGAVLNSIRARFCSACGAHIRQEDGLVYPAELEPETIAFGDAEPVSIEIPHSPRYCAYVDTLLRPGEQVLYRTRQHPARLARALLLGLLVVVTLAFISLAAPITSLLKAWIGPTQAALVEGATLCFFCGLILLGVLSSLLGLSATELAVTDQRILGRIGGLIQRRVDIPLGEIAALSASDRTLSLLGHGSVAVFIPGRGTRHFNFIPDPFTFCQALILNSSGGGREN